MKILFYGRTQGNSGPDNVNRSLYAHLTPAFLPARQGGSFQELWKDLNALLSCDALVVSGLSRKGCFLTAAAKLLGKRCVYLLHGCAAWERETNGLSSLAPERQERYLLKTADALLAVSRMHRDWMARRYPQYGEKLGWVNPGRREFPKGERTFQKKRGSILAAGADRPVKNNLTLAQAVEQLEGQFHLEVCGASCHGNPFESFSHTAYLGLLSQEAYWRKLEETEIFVVNSSVEPFSLSALEALDRGCSLLLSSQTGVRDLLTLEESDLIWDPLDTEELKNKLLWIQAHPNGQRISVKPWSWADAVARLEQLCREGGCP